ncbi:hypothetical protein BKA62DRAFT_698098 [Auriculariales sp. MPI-PUGE-AT-0066]|nr:hypothetical protein BKA62DRAFT_698098 [Auriculariales sp. MPI-PUGE-AT-0066]
MSSTTRDPARAEYERDRRASSYVPGHAGPPPLAGPDPSVLHPVLHHLVLQPTRINGPPYAAATADPYSRSPHGAPPDSYSRSAHATTPDPYSRSPRAAAADPYSRSPHAAVPDPYSRSPHAAAADPYSRSPHNAAADPYSRSPHAAAADPYQRSPYGAAAADPYQRTPSYPSPGAGGHPPDPYQRSPYAAAAIPPNSSAIADQYRRSPYSYHDMPLAGGSPHSDPYGAAADPYAAAAAAAAAAADPYQRSPYGGHPAIPGGPPPPGYGPGGAYGPPPSATGSLSGRSAYNRSSAPPATRAGGAYPPVPRVGDPPSSAYSPMPGGYPEASASPSGRSLTYPANAASAYSKYLANPREFAGAEQLQQLMPHDRDLAGPAAPASPPGFHRQPSLQQPYTYFDAFMILDDMDGFYRETPHMPAALVSHDIFHEDWIRFMQDLAFAWSGRTPAPELSRDGRPPHNGVIVADLVDVWNSRFYHPRKVELIVYRGRTPVSGRRFLDEYYDPRDNSVKWSLCLRCSSA